VDEKCRIRWAACADAKPEEAMALETCTAVLLDRLEKRNNKASVSESGNERDALPHVTSG